MIYLIRHADAVSDEVDPARPLSKRGRDQVARVCEILAGGPAFAPAEIWHSPLVRSRETAELLARGLGLAAPILLKPGLEPDDDPASVASLLMAEARDIAVVGHEPHLGVLTTLIAHGGSRHPIYYPFPKAGVVCLYPDGSLWRSRWLVRST
jgi:phosphohistidine phosphatase